VIPLRAERLLVSSGKSFLHRGEQRDSAMAPVSCQVDLHKGATDEVLGIAGIRQVIEIGSYWRAMKPEPLPLQHHNTLFIRATKGWANPVV
jgi:hypothetical protein